MGIFSNLFGGTGKSGTNPGNKSLDLAKLLNSPDTNGSIIEIDNFICELCAWGDEMTKLTDQQRNFYYNQSLEREINNGGFSQYFSNSSGDFANETVKSLRLIGADKTADILEQAIAEFPNKTIPQDSDERQELLEAIEEAASENWEKLEQRFFAYEDDLNTLNLDYVRQHQDKF